MKRKGNHPWARVRRYENNVGESRWQAGVAQPDHRECWEYKYLFMGSYSHCFVPGPLTPGYYPHLTETEGEAWTRANNKAHRLEAGAFVLVEGDDE